MKLSVYYVVLGMMLGIVLLLSFYRLGLNPVSLYWDEYAIGIEAYSIAQTGKDIHGNLWLQAIYPSYGDFKAPVAIWLTAVSVKLMGLSELSVRLPFALMSLLGVIVLWFLLVGLLKKTNNPPVYPLVWLTILFALTSPWHFHFSRIGFESGLSFAFVIVTLICVLYGLTKSGWWFIGGALCGVLSTYAYFSARYIAPMFVISLVVILWKDALRHIKWLIIGSALWFIAIIPLYTSPFYAQSQQVRLSAPNLMQTILQPDESANLINQSGNTFISRIIYHRYVIFGKYFINNFLSHYSPAFLFLNGDSNLRHHTGFGGQLLFATALIIFLGLIKNLMTIKNPLSLLVLVWFLIAPLTASIPSEVPHASRAIYLLLPLCIIFYKGLEQGTSLIEKLFFSIYRQNKLHPLWLPGIVMFIIMINFGLYVEDYFRHYPYRSSQAWQLGNKYIGLASNGKRGLYDQFVVTEAYRLPALPILFYNPGLIRDVQETTILKNSNQDYSWLRTFGAYTFQVNQPIIPQNGTLYMLAPEQADSLQVSERYLFTDGSPALDIVGGNKDL